jgi:hypothetical protein
MGRNASRRINAENISLESGRPGSISQWTKDSANVINSTIGSMWPFLTSNKSVTSFRPHKPYNFVELIEGCRLICNLSWFGQN